jgi:hypothetical protein
MIDEKKQRGGARNGAGRKRIPIVTKKVTVAARVSPAYKDWMKDKSNELGVSMGELLENLIMVWREQERKYHAEMHTYKTMVGR